MTSDQADTYKCVARNEYGTAAVTATLNVIEGLSIFCFISINAEPIQLNKIHLFSFIFISFNFFPILVGYKKSRAMQESRTGTFG